MYMNYSAFSDILDENIDRKNSTHPHLKHMAAFDEEDVDIPMASSLPTEFSMRPDLTPTEETHIRPFEKPQVQGSPSMPVRSSNGPSSESAARTSVAKRDAVVVEQKSRMIPKLVAVVKTTILSSIFFLLIVCCMFIAIVELDILRDVRKIPEMVILRKEYYEPIKRSFIRAISKR